MGIPLTKIPEVRTFYGLEHDETTTIDFFNDRYRYPEKHVIAGNFSVSLYPLVLVTEVLLNIITARITAENPDEGFKPTSGKIERVRFQSTKSVWGYFSVGANGGIHEFADSQFGHLFATGNNGPIVYIILTIHVILSIVFFRRKNT